MTAIAVLHKDEILKRVAKGGKISDIGKDYGLCRHQLKQAKRSGITVQRRITRMPRFA